MVSTGQRPVQHSWICWGGSTTTGLLYHIYHSTIYCLFCWLWVHYSPMWQVLVFCNTVQQDSSCWDGSTTEGCTGIFVTVQINCLYLWQVLNYHWVMPSYANRILLRISKALRIKLAVGLIFELVLRTIFFVAPIVQLDPGSFLYHWSYFKI